MKQPTFLLDSQQSRSVVKRAIIEVCRFRSWGLFALHVRINHVHGVLEGEVTGSRVLNDWKAYSTRSLRMAGLVDRGRIVWSHGGSVHNLNTGESCSAAIRYVLDKQGEAMEIYWTNAR